jgi:hypothetical protein
VDDADEIVKAVVVGVILKVLFVKELSNDNYYDVEEGFTVLPVTEFVPF